MKILKVPNKIDCECECSFIYEQHDISYKTEIDEWFLIIGVDYYFISYVECPHCNKHHVISKRKLGI